MKGRFSNFSQYYTVFIFILLISACGGGSSDSGPNHSISADLSKAVFSNELATTSDDTFAIKVNFQGDGLLIGFAPDAENIDLYQQILQMRTENVTATSAIVHLNLINGDLISAGTYPTTVRLSTGNFTDQTLVHHDIDVSLLIWQARLNTDLVSFRGNFGDTALASQVVELTSIDNQWTIESDVEWITLDVTEGTGNGSITVTPTVTNFTFPQSVESNLIITEVTTGETKILPVEIGLDSPYLYSEKPHLSFANALNVSSTEQLVTIKSNSPTTVNWEANAEATWLTLTKVDDNTLKVTVDTSIEPTNTTLETVITLTANNNDFIVAPPISVSYFNASGEIEKTVIEAVNTNSGTLVAAPNKNELYLAVGNELRTYHQYTGELLQSLTISPEGSELEQFIVHPTGDILLTKAEITTSEEAEDGTVTETTEVFRYKVNLVDYAFTEILEPTIEYEPMQYVSFSGRHYIVTQALEFADSDLQRIAWDTENAFVVSQLDQASSTEAIYALDFANATLKRITATVNDFTTKKLVPTLTDEYRPELLGEDERINDFIVNNDETSIFTISPTSEYISYDGEKFTDNGLIDKVEGAVTLQLTKSSNGRAHYVRLVSTSGFVTNIYDNSAVLVATVNHEGKQSSEIEVSSDDQRLLIKTTDYDVEGTENETTSDIEIVTLEPFDVSTSHLNFITTLGNIAIASQELTISGVSDQWTATSDSEWLTLSPHINDDGNTLIVDINTSKLTTWGLITSVINITDPVTGFTRQIIVEIAVDEVRLFGDIPALSFSQYTDKETLTHTVNIVTNREIPVAWLATTDATWLTLTPNVANNTLMITADPAQVSDNGLVFADINLTPVTSTESMSGIIKVSFDKGDFDSSSLPEIPLTDITPNDKGIVLDPLRPYVYIAQGDVISVINIIDGSAVNTITSLLADVDLTNLVIHPDGSLLLASNIETYTDENSAEQTRINHYQVTLSDMVITQLDADLVDIQYRPEKIIMVSGKPVVVTQTLEYANLALMTQYWDSENVFLTSLINDVVGNNKVIAFNTGASSIVQHEVTYNAFADITAQVASTEQYTNANFAFGVSNMVANSAGSNIYTANTTTEWSTYDGTNFIDQGVLRASLRTVNVAVDSSDNSYFYRFDANLGIFILSKYDNNQVEAWTIGYSAGSVDSYFATSYKRLLHYTDSSSTLVIEYLPD